MRTLLIALLVLLVCPALSFASDEEDLRIFLLKGNFDRAIQSGQNLVSKGRANEDTYYLLGLALLKKREFPQARQNLQTALSKTSDQTMKDKINLAMADTYFLGESFQEAAQIYNVLLDKRSNNGMAPLLLLRLAQCNLKQGKWEEGNKYLARLRNEFPSSMEAQMSEPLSSTDEFFCVQAGSFTDQDNAEAFAADLRKEGYDAYVSGVSVDNKTLFRVRVGECETRTEAEELKARMDASGYDSKIYP